MNAEETKKRLELLKKAREQLTAEYFAHRTELHRQWQIDSQANWVANKTLLPYPPTMPLPTEKDIVARALDLYQEQINPNSAVTVTDRSQSATPIIDQLQAAANKVQDVEIVDSAVEQNNHSEQIAENSSLSLLLEKFVRIAKDLDAKPHKDSEQ